jgi:hypothetical protein
MRDENYDRYGRYHGRDHRENRNAEQDSAGGRDHRNYQSDRWRQEQDNFRNSGSYDRRSDDSAEHYRDERGYRGRSSADYRNSHEDNKWHYDPSDYNVNGYRRNPESDHYNRFSDESDQHRERNYRDPSGRYEYDYYQSYPSYGQGAPYNDHEWGYIQKQEGRRRRGIDNEDQYMSRERRYESSHDPDPYRR